jgi:hypothetical protein
LSGWASSGATARITCAATGLFGGLLWAAQSPAAAVEVTDVSGSLGYAYRAILGSSTSNASSNQLRGSVATQGYLYEPWFANFSLGLRATEDSTKYDQFDSSTRTTILGGDFDLGLLQQSRTPFSLSYHASDSRVDVFSVPSPLTTLGSVEFKTQRLALRQAYFDESGDRFQATFDHTDWDSQDRQNYSDQMLGLEMNVTRPQHTLNARTSYQVIDQSVNDQQTDIKLASVDHFYHPDRALRIDSTATYYDSDISSTRPLNATNLPDSGMNYGQASSFVFWRPVDRPLSVSAGVRVFDLSADNAGKGLDQGSISVTGGIFYQLTKNLRLDGNADASWIDNNVERTTASRQRFGALYQSDLHEPLKDLTYTWNLEASVQRQDTGSADIQDDDAVTALVRLGHDAQRMWMTDGRGTFRLSLSQSVSGVRQSGDFDGTTERLDNTGTFTWDRYDPEGSSTFQASLADSRGFGDQKDSQQFANLQFLRSQVLTAYSVLNGNLTLQAIRRDFNGQGDDDTVTATGQLTYQHLGLFGVPQLRFNSDLRLARAASEDGIDRAEWENRVDYVIGLVDTSASWRYIRLGSDQNDEAYHVVYFMVNRRF